jgi:alkanesulfonate monooxygenase SsuD/methylene tetrahydromethanopterin reductase-like flavin-dependent oxidoreductase (luciferase family)
MPPLALMARPGGETAICADLANLAREADAAGVASFWVMDHFFQLRRHREIDDPMLEAWSTLCFIAAVTERMQLGTMVTDVTYRHPGVLIKAATTLDVLSGGRGALGIGAAWFDREHHGLGIPFPPLKTRFEFLAETLQIAHQMWRDDASQYEGRHYQMSEPIPVPARSSGPIHRSWWVGAARRKPFAWLRSLETPATSRCSTRGPISRRLKRSRRWGTSSMCSVRTARQWGGTTTISNARCWADCRFGKRRVPEPSPRRPWR